VVAVIVVGLLLALPPRASHAAATALPSLQTSTLDQSNEPPPPISLAAAGFLQAQTFTAGRTGLLDRIELLGSGSDGGAVAIQITAVDANGLPTGPALGSGSLYPSEIPRSSAVWTSVSIAPAVPVLAGVQYAIVKPNGTPSAFFWAISAPTNPYPAGVSVQFTFVTERDFAFRTYVGPNTAPAASDDNYTTDEDTPLTGNVLSNDSDVDGTALTAVKVSDPAHGTLTLNSNGDFTYTPAPNYNGTDSFSYKANDAIADSNVVLVTITVNAVNDAPIITQGSATGVTMSEDGAPTLFSLTLNATDAEGNTLTWSISTPAANGTASASGTGASKAIGYTPNANYAGSDSFAVQVSDGNGGTDIIIVNVTVSPVNDAPVAAGDSSTSNEDTPATITVLANDSDPDGDALTVSIVTGPSKGQATVNADGTITYTPNANATGADSFTYTVSDGTTSSSAATVNITINAVNDTPLAVADSYSTDEDTALSGNVLANDSDPDLGDTRTAVLVSGPAHGTLTLNADGSFTYTPAANSSGPESFSYRARDAAGAESPPVTVAITVTPVNDAPTIAVAAGGVCLADFRGQANLTVGDAETAAGSLLLSASSSNTTLVPNGNITLGGSGANRTVTIATVSGRSGSATVTLTVSDSEGASNTTTVTVVAGTSNNDTLTGTSGADMLFAGNAQDTLTGNGGNDLLCAGQGDDTLTGGEGDDTLDAGSGQDKLNGGAGNDWLLGGQGDDTLTGDVGADRFDGGAGNDRATDVSTGQGDTQANIP
jgi:VCBS repeat-containing protein